MDDLPKDVCFTECRQINDREYVFAFFFKYRIDWIRVHVNQFETRCELLDKGVSETGLSDQQQLVIDILEKTPEKYYLKYKNYVL
jgi:hypothetical protein